MASINFEDLKQFKEIQEDVFQQREQSYGITTKLNINDHLFQFETELNQHKDDLHSSKNTCCDIQIALAHLNDDTIIQLSQISKDVMDTILRLQTNFKRLNQTENDAQAFQKQQVQNLIYDWTDITDSTLNLLFRTEKIEIAVGIKDIYD